MESKLFILSKIPSPNISMNTSKNNEVIFVSDVDFFDIWLAGHAVGISAELPNFGLIVADSSAD